MFLGLVMSRGLVMFLGLVMSRGLVMFLGVVTLQDVAKYFSYYFRYLASRARETPTIANSR